MKRLVAVLLLSLLPACGGEALVEEEKEAEEAGQDEFMLGSLRPLVDDGTVISRESWGARPPGTCRPQETPTRITIHHVGAAVGNDPIAWLRSEDYRTRITNGWCDLMYHFAVARDGRIFEMVSSGRRAAHVADHNTKNIGIVLIGNFQTETPTAAALASLKTLLRGLHRVYGIPLNRVAVKGHYELAATSCPGTNVKSRLNTIVAEAAVNPPPPPPPPPSGCGVLAAGASLARGQGVPSCDGRFLFVHQTDGNVVLYHGTTPLWHTSTYGRATSTLAMQGDGNLVLYAPGGTALWHTHTYNRPGAFLAVQDDGNAVIYKGSTALWSTRTCCR